MGFRKCHVVALGMVKLLQSFTGFSSVQRSRTATAQAGGIDSFVKKLVRFAREKDDLLTVGL
jgi:hypothetical protein